MRIPPYSLQFNVVLNLTWALYLSRHFIIVNIFCANQLESNFLCLPLKSCQNVSQEINQFTLKREKYLITRTWAAFMFSLLNFIDWFSWETNLKGFQWYINLDSDWLAQKMCSRVSEPACFGLAPAPGIFYPEPAPTSAPGKIEHDFGIFENWLQSVLNSF